MDDRAAKAFEFAADSTKQVITLSTAIVALTVTFAKDIFADAGCWETGMLVAAWITYLVSIIGGVWTLLALTGTLEPGDESTAASIRGPNVTIPALLQMLMFLVATGLIVVYGVLSVT